MTGVNEVGDGAQSIIHFCGPVQALFQTNGVLSFSKFTIFAPQRNSPAQTVIDIAKKSLYLDYIHKISGSYRNL
jgi:hypothetical protein